MPHSESEVGSKVSDPQHSQKLLRVLRSFWQEQSFHDALLVVDGEELPVQKNILAAASPYVRWGKNGSGHLPCSSSTESVTLAQKLLYFFVFGRRLQFNVFHIRLC